MPAAQPKTRRKRRWTEADLLSLPDDGRKYELVRGRLVEVPTGGRHGKISVEPVGRLYAARPPHVTIYDSSTGFRMVGGSIRSPDVSAMRNERLPEGKSPAGFIDGAPDLAVEVVSPAEKASDLLEKIGEYFESGSQEVWLLFPERKQVIRYRANLEVEVLNENDLLKGEPILPGFAVRVGDLFVE
ncbi:MAG: Uma2 family endonuclease [Fimbriimonadales bacterium]|nr:Uma2 family endonuclease [Fimbriimonadales bacterium]